MNDFSKKIPSYLDGMMNEAERVDFEAYVAGNPDFARLFRQKQMEQEAVAQRVPQAEWDEATQLGLEAETREVIANLFKEDENAPAGKKLKSWFRDLF